MRIYDITLPLHARLACWPGDTPYRFRWSLRRAEGETVNLGEVTLGVHMGTHMDAPYHYMDDGATADNVPLAAFIGPARVVDVRGIERIRRTDLDRFDLSQTPRVLLKTNAWTDYSRFPDTVPIVESDVPEWLHAQGVVLLGVDVPSVDLLDSKDLPNHHALGAHGIQIIESLYLVETPPGVYELIALPMRLVGADGAPLRAVLRAVDRRKEADEPATGRDAPDA